jgi:hypothetical protein
MNFFKNLYTVAASKVTKFQSEIDEKAGEIRREEETAKRQQASLLEESRRKKTIEQDKLIEDARQRQLIEDEQARQRRLNEHEQLQQRELIECKNYETLRNLRQIIRRGELSRIKSAITCQNDIWKALSDDEYNKLVIETDNIETLYEQVVQIFINAADEVGEDKIKDYLNSLKY